MVYVFGIRWYYALVLAIVLIIGCTIFPDNQETIAIIVGVVWVGLFIKRCMDD